MIYDAHNTEWKALRKDDCLLVWRGSVLLQLRDLNRQF
jgi:hypothetical protein